MDRMPRSPHPWGLLLALVTAVATLSWQLCSAAEAARSVTPEQVELAIQKGVEAARRNLRNARKTGNVGYCAVGVLALLNAGVPADDKLVADAIKLVVTDAETAANDRYYHAYSAGVVNMMLATLKDPRYDRLARAMTLKLQNTQSAQGGWGTAGIGGFLDYSRTQFALLGLKAAEEMGIPVPARIFSQARQFLESGRALDGGWGYRPHERAYGSMTAAAVGSLFIIHEQLGKQNQVCGTGILDANLKAGVNWLGERFRVDSNPRGHAAYHYYYLYALERIGVLSHQKFIGGHDWYREGAAYLVSQQMRSGDWAMGQTLATEFALLFLAKGRAPVVIQKLQHGPDWDPDPYDTRDLVQHASRELKTPLSAQVISQAAPTQDLLAAPILYLQGHRTFALTPEFRVALKEYVEQGGTVFASACCGAEDFDKSFRTEMKLLFPECALEKLPENHDLFSIRHKIADPKAFTLEGLNTGCRSAVLYAPHDICCAWGGCKGCRDRDPIRAEAKELGVNLIAYALGFMQLRDKLQDAPDAEKTELELKRGALVIGQLYHEGEWNPDPSSIPNLTRTMKEQFGINGDVLKKRVVLGLDDPCQYPILYLTGHRQFSFSTSQVQALRDYLDKGGFLLADPCCGKSDFDTAFKKLCQQLYPDRPLKAVPADHPLLEEPFQIVKVEHKPAVKSQFPDVGQRPQLEMITGKDKRAQVLYSRFNLGCELQGHVCANCLGVSARDAYRIAVNAIQYALAH